MTKQEFGRRLAALRAGKGVSARDMSLSMGQSPGYINNIENGVNYPSMQGFFYICEFLRIQPRDFFDFDAADPARLQQLARAAKGLTGEQLDHLIALANGLQ